MFGTFTYTGVMDILPDPVMPDARDEQGNAAKINEFEVNIIIKIH